MKYKIKPIILPNLLLVDNKPGNNYLKKILFSEKEVEKSDKCNKKFIFCYYSNIRLIYKTID